VLSELTPGLRVGRNHRNTLGEIRSLIEGDYHFILGWYGTDELFDLNGDPTEAKPLKNRLHLPAMALLWEELRAYNTGFPRKLPASSTGR
jgi:hypothetical protein